jgi:predicted Zn-dependent protease
MYLIRHYFHGFDEHSILRRDGQQHVLESRLYVADKNLSSVLRTPDDVILETKHHPSVLAIPTACSNHVMSMPENYNCGPVFVRQVCASKDARGLLSCPPNDGFLWYDERFRMGATPRRVRLGSCDRDVATVYVMGGVWGKRPSAYRRVVVISAGLILVPFAALLAQNQPSFDDLASEAAAARIANDVPRAIQLYQQAVQLNPQWDKGWWYLGLLQYETNAYPAARDALTRYLKLAPTAGPAIALRGLCEFETGQYDQSLKDIETGISLGAANQPRNEQILKFHAALLLTKTGRFQEALDEYGWFAQNGITNPELLLGLGLAGLRTPALPKEVVADQRDFYTAAGDAVYEFLAKHRDEAQQAFQDLFHRFPSAPNAHYLYGYLLLQTDPDHAIEELKQELKVSPSNIDADVLLAWACLLENKPAQALPYAQKAFAAQPSASVSLLVLGRSLVETGDLKNGTEYLERAVQLDPKNLEIHIALAHAYSEEGLKQEAWRERMLSIQMENHGTSQVANP